MRIGVYQIQINEKKYIWSTTVGFKKRWAEHLRKLKSGKHSNKYLQNMFNKYGAESLIFTIIEEVEDKEKMLAYEQAHIDKVNPELNICRIAGNTLGYGHTLETKEKQRRKKDGVYLGKNNPFFGKTHSDEQKQKWSEDRKGNYKSMDKARLASIEKIKRAVLNIDTGIKFESIKEAAEHYNLKSTHITRVCVGKRKHTGGYAWEYIIQGEGTTC
jgi:group I intron endonuclease